MQLFTLDRAALLARLKTSETGLNAEQARRRMGEFGPNLPEQAAKKNYLLAYLRQYTHFFALLMETAALLAFTTHFFAPGQGSDILGLAILGAVAVNATFTFWQEYRADRAMAALLRLVPLAVTVRREGKPLQVPAEELVPGDILLLEEGDRIAADGIVLSADSLALNLSSLTGESAPVPRSASPSSGRRALEAANTVFAGTTVVSGSGTAVVSATGNATEFGRIASLTKNVRKSVTPMQREIMHITRVLTAIALGMGALFFVLGLFSGQGLLVASIFTLSLIVANVPEGLLPTISLSLSLAGQRMARRNALIKNLDSVETLGSTTVICTDKTGTLTRNEMTLHRVWLAGGEEIAVRPDRGGPGGTAQARFAELLLAGLLNCRAFFGPQGPHGDPTELALVAAAAAEGIAPPPALARAGELPFSGERKMMSTIYRDGDGFRIFSKGAVEVLLERCASFRAADAGTRPLTAGDREAVLARAALLEEEAYRLLLLATGEGKEERDLTLLGLAAILDPPRPEVPAAIATCKTAGIRTVMLTGDNPLTAGAIARRIGMEHDRVVTGPELEQMGDDALEELLARETPLFARMASGQKLRIATALQNIGEVVAMTGDGVNDAPALKRADIGIAMGLSGTEVAREAADMVLLDDNFSSIVSAIEEGRTVYFNIKKFVTYILASNMPEIVPYILHFFLKIPLPLSVIQILSIDLGTDLLPGLALGSEKPEKGVMRRPPVGRQEKILDREVFKRGYCFLGLIEAAAAMTAFLSFLLLHGWQYGERTLTDPLLHRQAMTMTLLGAVSCQILNAWTLRSWEFSSLGRGLFANPLLLLAMAVEFFWIWMLLGVEPVQKIFNTAPVEAADLLVLLPFPLLLFGGHELYKWRQRRTPGNQALPGRRAPGEGRHAPPLSCTIHNLDKPHRFKRLRIPAPPPCGTAARFSGCDTAMA